MCFTLEWIKDLLILAVIVAAIFAVLQVIVPWALSKLPSSIVGEGVNILTQVFKIVVWAIVIIVVIVVCFSLISCLWSWAGGSLSLLHH